MLEGLIKYAFGRNASDVHLTEGAVPVLRVNGRLERAEDLPCTNAGDIESLLRRYCPDADTAAQELDFACELPGLCRLRVNAYLQGGRRAAAIRLIKGAIPTLAELGLPTAAQNFAKLRSGLVLVAGQTGSGKSTTLAALAQSINRSRALHIITLEQPVEYCFTQGQSLIHQRQVGTDTESFAAGLRAALREDPDVIVVGELRDAETFAIAVTAAETGHLVLGTLHTRSAVAALARVLDSFAPEQQRQIRAQLAANLQGIICQQLVPNTNGGRTAAFEVLTLPPAVRSLIREGREHQLPGYLQTGRQQGMQCMDYALAALAASGAITRQTAQEYALDAELLTKYLAAK